MNRLTIGVLTPYLYGDYCVTLLRSIHHAARSLGIALVIAAPLNASRYDERFAYDHIDGWITILDVAGDAFIEDQRSLNKPVIGIGIPDDRYPVVAPDNRKGFAEAVGHLIAHGHERIAFVGYLGQKDIVDRFHGYRDALQKHGLPYSGSYLIEAGKSDLIVADGREAARVFLERKLPCTAVACATDGNAIGFMEELQLHGCRIPDDIAVIGCDDSEPAETAVPGLTSLNQSVERMAEMAVRELHAEMTGRGTLPAGCLFADSKLTVRASCGCPGDSGRSRPAEAAGSGGERQLAVLEDINANLYQLIRGQKEIGKMMVRHGVETTRFLELMQTIYRFRSCLCLWAEEEPERVDVFYRQDFTGKEAAGLRVPPEAFPAGAFIGQSGSLDDVTILFQLHSPLRSWGAIALHGRLDDISLWYTFEMIVHSIELYVSALEREQLYREARRQENRYKEVAEQLEIVSRTTNDGIFVWDVEGRSVQWNNRLANLLQPGTEEPGPAGGLLEKLVPRDRRKMKRRLLHFTRHKRFQEEIRLGLTDGQRLWIYMAGECTYDEDGKIRKVIGSVKDITGRKTAEEQMAYMAYHDSLTGLYNRTKFYERFEHCLEEAARSNRRLAVLLLDLDRFKAVNDTYGHLVGDKLLQFVAGRIGTLMGERDVFARLGGDEFAILLPDIERSGQAEELIGRIRELFRTPFTDGAIRLYARMSIGAGLFPDDGLAREELLKKADERMYRAKE